MYIGRLWKQLFRAVNEAAGTSIVLNIWQEGDKMRITDEFGCNIDLSGRRWE